MSYFQAENPYKNMYKCKTSYTNIPPTAFIMLPRDKDTLINMFIISICICICKYLCFAYIQLRKDVSFTYIPPKVMQVSEYIYTKPHRPIRICNRFAMSHTLHLQTQTQTSTAHNVNVCVCYYYIRQASSNRNYCRTWNV